MNKDLHSLNKLKSDIKAAGLISVFLPKDQRMRIKELEKQLAEIENLILRFNSYFTNLGWCAYDSMNLLLMKEGDGL